MTRQSNSHADRAGSARPNFLAVLITCSAVGVLVLNFQLEPARAISRKSISPPIITQLAPRSEISETVQNEDGTAEDQRAVESEQEPVAASGMICQGRVALLLNLALLEDGIRWLEKHPGYTANFFKQEWLEDDQELTEIQTIEMKARHEPFSVYMHWLDGDAGREVLYIYGQNENKLKVHAGGNGLKSKLTLKLDPHGSLAMGESRHPITQAGLLNMAKTMVDYRRRDLLAGEGNVTCCLGPDVLFDERPCYNFIIGFQNEDIDSDYRKSLVLIDKEWSIPVMVKNYGWYDTEDEHFANCTPQELDVETFVEFYAYSNINFSANLKAADFDSENNEYRF